MLVDSTLGLTSGLQAASLMFVGAIYKFRMIKLIFLLALLAILAMRSPKSVQL